MVHLGDADADVGALTTELREVIRRGDLDAHVAALIIATGFRDWRSSPWNEPIRQMLDQPYDPTTRPQDVSIHGVRSFFRGEASGEYQAMVVRELARKPLPPAVTMRDDDRVLLGIAAGIGASPPEQRTGLRDVAGVTTGAVRSDVLRFWAAILADGRVTLSDVDARAALRLIQDARLQTHDDRVALLWLIGRVLDAHWTPDDEALAELESRRRDLRRSLVGVGTSDLLPLSIAMLIDAAAAAPSERLMRASVLDLVLAIVDGFTASASVVAHRYAKRAPFLITDEYDVQDLFRALVLPHLPDCEPEDPTPKHAGKSSRLDFVSKRAQMGFEMKFVRSERHAGEVRGEILLDEATYHAHPHVHEVVALIYDPNRHISDASRPVLERDLSTTVTVGGRTVTYHVRVRG